MGYCYQKELKGTQIVLNSELRPGPAVKVLRRERVTSTGETGGCSRQIILGSQGRESQTGISFGKSPRGYPLEKEPL